MNIACPHCRGIVADTPELRGRVIACPHCGGQFMLPAGEGPVQPPPAPHSAASPSAPRPAGPSQERPLPSPQAQPSHPAAQHPAGPPLQPGPQRAGPYHAGTPYQAPLQAGSQQAGPAYGGAPPARPPQAGSPPPRPAGYGSAAHVARPVAARPVTPAQAMPARPMPANAAPGHAAPAYAGQARPASPSAPAKQGSSIMDQRRARKRGSGLKTVLLILFILVAAGITIGTVASLSLYDWLSGNAAKEEQRREKFIGAANTALARLGVDKLGDDAKVEYYDDGCIVSGTSFAQDRGTVTCEISIGIHETENHETLFIDEVLLNGTVAYKGKP